MIWFVIGVFFAFFGLLLLLILPPVKEEALKEEREIVAVPDFIYKQWFYLDEERSQKGPVGFTYLVDAWKKSRINEKTYIWTEGMETWLSIKEQNDIKTFLETSVQTR